MRFLLLICHGDDFSAPPELGEETLHWMKDTDERGMRIVGSRLRPPEDARTVRRREGQTTVGRGPFASTEEHIAGFDLIEAHDLDEALRVVEDHPMSAWGSIEVRPLWEE